MQQKAFSLVELSIVLVILGLLVGGILTGQSLIRAAELRSVTTEYQNYQTAVMTFRDKYFALPGDMNNATDFWGAMSDCSANNPTGDATCSGNGDGVIDAAGANKSSERFQFWRHLMLAGLIEGSYTGIAGSSSAADSSLGVNIPAAKISGSGWFVNQNSAGNSDVYTTVTYGNDLIFGSVPANSWPYQPNLTPEEAWNIDKKMDDGRPAFGQVVARHWDDECASADDGSSTADDPNASYRLSDNSILCAFIFPDVF